MSRYAEVRLLLDSVEVLYRTRYHARWARRLRETTGLSCEDAAIIALASFGTNSARTILGIHLLITYDQPMMTGYSNHLPILESRLRAMTAQLPVSFHHTVLPQLTTPNAVRFE